VGPSGAYALGQIVSILAYVGFPGCGKSYSVVEQQLLPALRAARMVVTNLPLNMDRIKRDFPQADVREFPTASVVGQPELILDAVPPGALLILDEVMKLFPAGTKANQVPEPYRLMFAEHRHRVDAAGQSTQIVLIAQDLNQIGTFCRQLVEQTFRMTKLSTLGIPSSKRFRVDMYPGPQCGPNPPAAQRIRQVFGRYKKEVYQYYISHTQSEANTDDGADEEKVDRRANVFKKPFLVMLPIIAIVGFGFIWFKGGYLLDKYHKKPDASSAAAGGAGRPAESAPARPSVFGAALAKVEGAGDWRVVGTLKNVQHPEKSIAILRSESLKASVPVSLSQCSGGEGDQALHCRYDGFSYSESGRPLVALPGLPTGTYSSVVASQPKPAPVEDHALSYQDAYGPQELVEDPVTHDVRFVYPKAIRPHISAANSDVH
jgi:zona occludens toxin (predicted ATPase)